MRRANYLVVLGAVAIIAVANQRLLAQCTFPMEGIHIYQAQVIEHTDKHSVVLPGGALVHVWTGTDPAGFKRAYAQILTTEREPVFRDSIPPLSQPAINAYELQVVASTDGFAILVWREKTGAQQNTVRMQRLTAAGERTWQEWGCVGPIVEPSPNFYFSMNVFADSNAGIFIQLQGDRGVRETVWAIGSDGQLRRNWPQDGILPDSVSVSGENFADAWGGFWRRQEYPETNSFNRITAEGRRRWDEYRPLEPIDSTHYAVDVLSNGAYLFAKFTDSPEVGGITGAEIAVYDSTGERIAGRIFNLQESWGAHEFELGWAVSQAGTIALVFEPCELGYKDELYPVESPWVVRYEPLAENPLPWGEAGVQLPINQYSPLGARQIAIVNETTLIGAGGHDSDNYYVYGLNSAGELAWENQPMAFQCPSGFELISSSSDFWVVGSFKRGYGAWQVNSRGERPGGINPVWLMPKKRLGLYNLRLSTLSPNDLFVTGLDPIRGLIGQSLNSGGEAGADNAGRELDPDYPVPSINGGTSVCRGASGVVGRSIWDWSGSDSITGRLAIWDGNHCTSVQCRFEGEGQLLTSSSYEADNGSDQILVALKLDRIAYRLVAFNLHGQRLVTGLYECPIVNATILKMQYWPGHGWLIVTNYAVTLLDDAFNRLWQRQLPIHYLSSTISLSDTSFIIASAPFDLNYYRAYKTEISQSGDVINVNYINVFNDLSYPYATCISGYDGSFWFINKSDVDPLIQLLNKDNRILLGANGMAFQGRGQGREVLLPDREGGGWFIWEAPGTIKALHLNKFGAPWRGRYPMGGVDVFSDSTLELASAYLDTSNGRVWVTAGKLDFSGDGYGWATLRMQLLDDNLTGVTEPPLNLPGAFSLSAFPNPFNPTTTISFDLPKASPLCVRVYDLSGRRVSTLAEGYLQAGKHSTIWNADDVSAGVYLVKMEAGSFNAVRKVVLVK